MVDLVSEGVDAVVRMAELEDSELICRKLGEVPILTCAGAGYVARHGIPARPEDLCRHMLVNYALRMPAAAAEWDGQENGRAISVPMQSYLCVDNAESYVAGALHGHGLIQVPARDVAEDIAAGRLLEVLADFRPAPVPISVLYARRRHLAPRLKVFMDWLEELLRREGFVAPKMRAASRVTIVTSGGNSRATAASGEPSPRRARCQIRRVKRALHGRAAPANHRRNSGGSRSQADIGLPRARICKEARVFRVMCCPPAWPAAFSLCNTISLVRLAVWTRGRWCALWCLD